MNSEDVYRLMMEALDGELSESDWTELQFHLRARPDLAREWEAIRRVDALMRSAPMLRPAADFTQRTLARLPSSRQRLWVGVAVYLMLLTSGIIPLAALVWTAIQLVPVLGQPAFLRSLWQGAAEFVRLAGVVLAALGAGLTEFVDQQPAVFAWLLVMAVVVALWLGVYNRLVLQPRRI